MNARWHRIRTGLAGVRGHVGDPISKSSCIVGVPPGVDKWLWLYASPFRFGVEHCGSSPDAVWSRMIRNFSACAESKLNWMDECGIHTSWCIRNSTLLTGLIDGRAIWSSCNYRCDRMLRRRRRSRWTNAVILRCFWRHRAIRMSIHVRRWTVMRRKWRSHIARCLRKVIETLNFISLWMQCHEECIYWLAPK